MPIDFAAIAADYAPRFQLQLKPIGESFKRLGQWLTKRNKTLNALERSSRRYPLVWFARGGVSVWIDRSQHGALQLSEPPTFVQSLRAGGTAFVSGLRRTTEAVQEEMILPNLLAVVRRALGGIFGSIERFREPRPEMFEGGGRRASDLFGLAALAFRSIVSSTGQLRGLARDLGRSIRVLGVLGTGAVPSREPAAAPVERGLSFAEQLDIGMRYLVAALLILPILPDYIGTLFQAGWLRARMVLIDSFAGFERWVFQLRRRIIDLFFVRLSGFVIDALRIVWIVHFLVDENLRFFIRFGVIYAKEIINVLTRFFDGLTKYIQFWVDAVNGFRRLLEAIMDTDLMPFLVPLLGLPASVLYAAGALPGFTLGDVLDATGHAVRITLRSALTGFIETVRGAVLALGPAGWILYHRMGLRRRLDLLQQIVDALFQRPAAYPTETAAFRLPTRLPNLSALVLGPDPGRFGRALVDMARGMTSEVREIIDAGAAFLTDIGRHFERTSAEAAQLGSPEAYRALALRAEHLSGLTFGPQVEELQRRIEERAPDPVAQAFEGWITQGGFEIVGNAIPLYVAEMRQYWLAQQAAGEEPMITITPTSPHIIARRVQLGRVRMRRLVIEAQGRALDDQLVGAVAGNFKEAVEQAYSRGNGVLERARAAG